MKQIQRRKAKAESPSRSCGCLILKSRSPRFSTVCRAWMRSGAIATPSTNSWIGTAPNRGFPSARQVVVRYRMHLESRHLAPGTINLRLGAVRRLAYEAADCGLLSADLAAGIRRVKGVKKLGVRLGNWLTAEQGITLWQAPDRERLKGKRDRALLSVLLACGLRRHEVAELAVDHLQQREGHWAIINLSAKGGHVRTVPVPDWVYCELSTWMEAAGINGGRVFRRVSSAGKSWGDGVTEKLAWHVVKEFATKTGAASLAPHDLRRYAESQTMPNGVSIGASTRPGAVGNSA